MLIVYGTKYFYIQNKLRLFDLDDCIFQQLQAHDKNFTILQIHKWACFTRFCIFQQDSASIRKPHITLNDCGELTWCPANRNANYTMIVTEK